MWTCIIIVLILIVIYVFALYNSFIKLNNKIRSIFYYGYISKEKMGFNS